MNTMLSGYGHKKAMRLVQSDLLLGIGLALLLGLLSARVASAEDLSSDEGIAMFGSPKRSGARGFHEGIFDQGFGGFSTLKKRGMAVQKRRPEMTSRGIHGDAFTGGFGDFYTMKRSFPASKNALSSSIAPLVQGYIDVLKDVEHLGDIEAQAEIVAAASDKLQKIKGVLLQ